jgi:hypothetical protein
MFVHTPGPTATRASVLRALKNKLGVLLLIIATSAAFALPSPTAAASAPAGASGVDARPNSGRAVDPPRKKAGIRVPARVPGPQWIGARRVGKKVGYRIDPMLRAPTRLRSPKSSARVWPANAKRHKRGRAAVARNTARAAWIVSRYGGFKNAAQGAAVEVALTHLLQDKPWHLKGRKTKARLAWSSQRLVVRSLARVMIRDSKTQAGPYNVKVSGERVPAGAASTLTVEVTSSAGRPMPGLRVDFTVAGAAAGTATTTARGVASLTHTPAGAGVHEVTATVRDLPASALQVITAKRPKRASRLVVLKAAKPTLGRGTVAAATSPLLELAPAAGQSAGDGANFAGRVRIEQVGPGGGDIPTTLTVYGPYTSQAAAALACENPSKVLGRASGSIPGRAGTHTLPPLALPVEGFYAYRVDLAGNAANYPGAACGGVTRADRQPIITVHQEIGNPRDTSEFGRIWDVTLVFDVSNLPLNYSGALTVSRYLYEPEDPHDCTTGATQPEGYPDKDTYAVDAGNTRIVHQFWTDHRASDVVAVLSPHDWSRPAATSCGAIHIDQ